MEQTTARKMIKCGSVLSTIRELGGEGCVDAFVEHLEECDEYPIDNEEDMLTFMFSRYTDVSVTTAENRIMFTSSRGVSTWDGEHWSHHEE